MASAWFLLSEKGQIGPFTERQISELGSAQRFAADEKLRNADSGETETATNVFASLTLKSIRPIAPPPSLATAATSEVQATASSTQSNDWDIVSVMSSVGGMLFSGFAIPAFFFSQLVAFAPILLCVAIALMIVGFLLALIRRHSDFVLNYWSLAICAIGGILWFHNQVRHDAELFGKADVAWEVGTRDVAVQRYNDLIQIGRCINRDQRTRAYNHLIEYHADKKDVATATKLVDKARRSGVILDPVTQAAKDLVNKGDPTNVVLQGKPSKDKKLNRSPDISIAQQGGDGEQEIEFPENARQVSSHIGSSAESPEWTDEQFASCLHNLICYVSSDARFVEFDINRLSWPYIGNTASLYIRLLDRDGNLLQEFFSEESFTVQPEVHLLCQNIVLEARRNGVPESEVSAYATELLKADGNRLCYELENSILRNVNVVEVGFSADY